MDRSLYELLAQSLHSCRPVETEWYILPFLANVLLVLKGGRLAYLVNSSDRKEMTMFQAVSSVSNELTSIATPYGPLILRKENKAKVEGILSEPGVDIHLAYAYVLDYAYQKKDWREGDSYAVTYHFRYQEIKSRLYTFRVPAAAYNDALRARVEEKVILFNSLLDGFAFYSGSQFFPDR